MSEETFTIEFLAPEYIVGRKVLIKLPDGSEMNCVIVDSFSDYEGNTRYELKRVEVKK